MGEKHIFTNIIGSFVFNENFKVLDKFVFEDLKDFFNKEIIEKDLTEKHNAKKCDEKNLKKILPYFKSNNFFEDFYKKNLLLTKKRIKESVKDDLLIIHSASNIKELEKSMNSLVKKLREWYEVYNPEFSNAIHDHEKFVKNIIEKEKNELLNEIKINKDETMGADLKEDDLKIILELAEEINNLYKLKSKEEKYLEELMNKICKNLAAVAGIKIGAKLIEHAGSIERLVKMPASTIQILGAESALFKHLRTGSKPPKYGILHEHPLIQKVKRDTHGKIARALADAISIAVKVDYFKGEFIGEKLMEKIEDKFKMID